MRVGYLGPPGTFSEQALLASAGSAGAGDAERVPLPTIREVVLALADGEVEHAVVPMENSTRGFGQRGDRHAAARRAGRARSSARRCWPCTTRSSAARARTPRRPSSSSRTRRRSRSARRFLRTTLPARAAEHATSTAEAVRSRAQRRRARARSATPLAAELYGGRCAARQRRGRLVEHDALRLAGARRWRRRGDRRRRAGAAGEGGWKTSVVFSGDGDGTPGWLVSCLAEFAVARREPQRGSSRGRANAARPLPVPRRSRPAAPTSRRPAREAVEALRRPLRARPSARLVPRGERR